VFPDPVADATGYLASAGSLPPTLAASWLKLFGGLSGALPVAIHANARPPLIARVNAARTGVDEVLAELRSAGVEAAPHVNGLSVVLLGHADLTRLPAFAEGRIHVQDPSATDVVARIDVAPGMRVLDLCAAPGTKTMHLAERMANRGEIVAVDVSADKLARIDENCRRTGVQIVRPILAGDVGDLAEGSFDVVLVDAPCSNTGVLARRPEARWRFSEAALATLVRDQRNLLSLGLGFVRPGGVCVYSTCSLQREEDESLVSTVASARKRSFSPRRTAPAGAGDPQAWSDGGFSAVCAS
jgi:16S rRNA (cytosine967-C5)-methyltransferase